jgi:hypothetical protein
MIDLVRYERSKKRLALMGSWDHPTHTAHQSRRGNDTFEGNAPAHMQLDGFGRRNDQKMIERVVRRVNQERVVHER